MKKITFLKFTLKILLISFSIYSCTYDDESSNLKKDVSTDVSEKKALEISEKLNHINISKKLGFKGVSQKSRKRIKEFKTIKDEANRNLFYITNYEQGGFVIISADNRISPILAYSDHSSFRTNGDEYSNGLVEWLTETKEGIQLLRDNNTFQSKNVKNDWDNLMTTYRIDESDEENDCQNEYEIVGPLLTTEWHQRCGFNDFMPTLNCSSTLPCGRALAGCVPIAVAQVMKYHNFPTSYNWSDMPDDYGTTTTASFIKDVHDAFTINFAGTEFPAIKYKCDGTGVDKDYNTAAIFTNKFGYSSANQAGYNYETVKRELRKNQPVILGGGRKSGWWIFSSYSNGHMWVCDGFSRSMTWSEDCQSGWGRLYLHMNWGWINGAENGWYAFNNFNNSNGTYNYKVKMVYNIKK